MILKARGRTITFPRRPLIMGIVNINDDSFCGDGTLDPAAAFRIAQELIVEGADIINAGAESARTNRGPISVCEEIDRLLPFMCRWQEWVGRIEGGDAPVPGQVWPPLLSLNTWRPEVAEAVLPTGGELLNDIGALPDDRNARICARYGVALVIMHSVGQPKENHTHVQYPDIMAELATFFRDRIRTALSAGLDSDGIVLDPGLDFAKQRGDNLRILCKLKCLHEFQRPILLPVSRKTVIGEVLDLPDPMKRDAGTIACLVAGQMEGAHIMRVHNTGAAVSAARVLDAIDSVAAGAPLR